MSRAVLFAFFILLVGCSSRVASMPDIDMYRSGFYERAESFERLYQLLQAHSKAVYLQWLEGELSAKHSTDDAYEEYSGRDADRLRQVLSNIGARFAGREGGRIYVGGFSAYQGEKVFVIEIEKSLGKADSHDKCSGALVKRPSGSCDVGLKDGWRVHYFWKQL